MSAIERRPDSVVTLSCWREGLRDTRSWAQCSHKSETTAVRVRLKNWSLYWNTFAENPTVFNFQIQVLLLSASGQSNVIQLWSKNPILSQHILSQEKRSTKTAEEGAFGLKLPSVQSSVELVSVKISLHWQRQLDSPTYS